MAWGLFVMGEEGVTTKWNLHISIQRCLTTARSRHTSARPERGGGKKRTYRHFAPE